MNYQTKLLNLVHFHPAFAVDGPLIADVEPDKNDAVFICGKKKPSPAICINVKRNGYVIHEVNENLVWGVINLKVADLSHVEKWIKNNA